MFNFFDEIKENLSLAKGRLSIDYNLVNISGQMLYAEGHKGLTVLSKTNITFKVTGGRIVVEGEDLILAELTENTLKITGKIKKTEVF